MKKKAHDQEKQKQTTAAAAAINLLSQKIHFHPHLQIEQDRRKGRKPIEGVQRYRGYIIMSPGIRQAPRPEGNPEPRRSCLALPGGLLEKERRRERQGAEGSIQRVAVVETVRS